MPAGRSFSGAAQGRPGLLYSNGNDTQERAIFDRPGPAQGRRPHAATAPRKQEVQRHHHNTARQPHVELKEEEYDDDDARTMSPRRSSEEIEKMGQDARQALIDYIGELMQTSKLTSSGAGKATKVKGKGESLNNNQRSQPLG
ncbi:hypothetical protein EJ07DRAFT_185944 [Lizonia empirigonia]|nr:hypothetical protein EJ07DRAFT_185944 [Lizonia empirigonia]